ncbi:hypothetical protein AXG55_03200 [Silvanigrella aquatica]|uniref:Transporter n=2 Tax=Silvanigrella aquatica TaxID=1915309 RepID=A0A1L4CYD3_9BACT|nr:hypothetical protein AXG55_03200 [Silvanigrella aquatica]
MVTFLFIYQTFAQENENQDQDHPPLLIQNARSVNSNQLLTLESAMNMTEHYSFVAKMSQQDLLISEAQENAALRSMLPNVSGSANYMFNSSSVNQLVGTSLGAQYGFPETNSSAGSLTLTQPLVGLYSLYNGLMQSSALTRAALQNRTQSRVDARFYGAQAFINAQKAEQLLKTAKSSIEVSEKQLKDGNAQFNAGKLTNADLLKFKLDYENSKTNLIQAETTYKVTLITLAEAIGIKNINLITLDDSDKSVWEAKSQKLPNLEKIFSPGMAKRHDLIAAKENVEASKYATQQTYSTYLPTLNFVATYSRNFLAKDITYNNVTYSASSYSDTLSYGLQLTWNLVDWGVRQAQISSTIASEQKAKYNLENLSMNARIDITNSYLQLQNAIQVLDSSKVSVQYAQDAYLQMKARFDNGQVTATDLIAAANDQTTARANLANAKGALDLAWMSFQKSIGGQLSTLN